MNYTTIKQLVDLKPPCVGTLQKSHPQSYFISCHINSMYFDNFVNNSVLVLQIMVIGNEQCLVEMIPQSVYDEWCGKQEGE